MINKSTNFLVTIDVATHQACWAFERGCALFRPRLMGVVSIALCILYAVVSCPDPTPKRRKGSGTHQALFGSCWLGMSEFCCTNQSRAMWLTCDSHVIPHYSLLVLLVRALDALLCQNDTLSWQSHDELHPVRPRKRSMCTRPFPCVHGGVWERD